MSMVHLADGRFPPRLFRQSPDLPNLPMWGRYRLSRRKQLVEEYFVLAEFSVVLPFDFLTDCGV
jgi:hypothetical protein